MPVCPSCYSTNSTDGDVKHLSWRSALIWPSLVDHQLPGGKCGVHSMPALKFQAQTATINISSNGEGG